MRGMRALYQYVPGYRNRQDAFADGSDFAAQRPFDRKGSSSDIENALGTRTALSAYERQPAGHGGRGEGSREAAASELYNPSLIGDIITEEEIWACTTCRNCEDQCPVMNEHVDKIIDLRRYLVLTEGKMDADAQRAMTSIERQGNPWGLNRKERENWRDIRDDVEVPTVKEMKKKASPLNTCFGSGRWDRMTGEARRSPWLSLASSIKPGSRSRY